MKRRILALGGVVALAVAGCSGGHHNSSTTTVPPASTADAPNPDVIPSVITVPYVNAVFKVLNHINGDAARALIAAGRITPEVTADLRSIYNDPLYSVEAMVAEQGLETHFANVRRPTGDPSTTVLRLLDTTANCIFVETVSNLSAVEIRPTASPASEYWELQPKGRDTDPRGINPTPWALSFNQDYLTPTSIPSPCSES